MVGNDPGEGVPRGSRHVHRTEREIGAAGTTSAVNLMPELVISE